MPPTGQIHSNFVLIFRNIAVSRSMRSLEWIRLCQKYEGTSLGKGCRGHSSHSPDLLKGQCTDEIGILDNIKLRNKKL